MWWHRGGPLAFGVALCGEALAALESFPCGWHAGRVFVWRAVSEAKTFEAALGDLWQTVHASATGGGGEIVSRLAWRGPGLQRDSGVGDLGSLVGNQPAREHV